jgi:hypothetical protein
MDVKGIGQELADRRLAAGVVDGRGVAGLEEPSVFLLPSRDRLIRYHGARRSTPELERGEKPEVE